MDGSVDVFFAGHGQLMLEGNIHIANSPKELSYLRACFSIFSLIFLHFIVYVVNCSPCSINDGQLKLEDIALTKAVLENTRCFLIDCGAEMFVWVGRVTQLEDRKAATKAVEVSLQTVYPCFISLVALLDLQPYHGFASCRNSSLARKGQRQPE